MAGGRWQFVVGPRVITGCALGFLWAWISTNRRRARFAEAGLRAPSQWLWFLATLVSMGSYLTLVCAVSLMALNDLLAPDVMWFMLGTAGLAFCTALLFTRFELPHQMAMLPHIARPADKALRKSA